MIKKTILFIISVSLLTLMPIANAGLNPDGTHYGYGVMGMSAVIEGEQFTEHIVFENRGSFAVTNITLTINTDLKILEISDGFNFIETEPNLYVMNDFQIGGREMIDLDILFDFNGKEGGFFKVDLQGDPEITADAIRINTESSKLGGILFLDITETTPYIKSIFWMHENRIIDGYPDNTFRADQCVTRAEFLKMLFLTERETLTVDGTNTFKDVDENEWYYSFVLTALEKNIIQGYADNTFRPNQCVNRVEAIKMATLEFNNKELPEGMQWSGEIPDVDRSAWYWNFLEYSLKSNSIGKEHIQVIDASTVDSHGKFNFFPAGSMSRKEVAEMLYRKKTLKDNDARYIYSDYMEPSYYEKGLLGEFEDKPWYSNLRQVYLTQTGQNINSTDNGHITDYSYEDFIVFIPGGDSLSCKKIYKYNKTTGVLESPEPEEQYCANYMYAMTKENIEYEGTGIKDGVCTSYNGEYFPYTGDLSATTRKCFSCGHPSNDLIEEGLTKDEILESLGEANEIIVKSNMSENLFGQGEERESTIKEGWIYSYPEDGWQGTIEVYFDENGIVIGKNCGMG